MSERTFSAPAFVAAVLVSASLAIAGLFCAARPQAHAAGLTSEALGAAASETTGVSIEVKYGQTEARSMLAAINAFRTGSDAWYWNESNTAKVNCSGLTALAYDYELERVAKLRAVEIALKYSHTRPDGSSKAWDAFDGWYYVGENIAAGYTSAKSVFAGWQETNEPYSGQGHRRNMLSGNFTAVGIGHVVCNGYHYWVQEFCAPTLDTAKTAADDSQRTVAIDVAGSEVTKRVATAAPSSIAVNVGKAVSLPAVSAELGTADTWPTGTVPVKVAVPSWSSGNAKVAALSGGKVKGLKEGSTSLVASVSVAGTPVKVSVPAKVVKAANPMSVAGKTAQVGYSKKKARAVKASAAYRFSKRAVGKVAYSRVAKGSSKWLPKVNPKTGAITVKAGTPKGKTQKVKVKVSAKGNASYKSLSKTVTVKVKVK